jgi:polyisoprenoid-binding protein YceI
MAENSVTFDVQGNPGFLTIEGKGARVNFGKIETKKGLTGGVFEVNLDAFDTGIKLRNEHMKKKYLETEKYPTAKFWLNPVAIPQQGYFNFFGKLTLHGVKKKIEGVGFVKDGVIEAKFTILMSEFNIEKATYAGVGVEDKVNIIAKLDANQGLVLP